MADNSTSEPIKEIRTPALSTAKEGAVALQSVVNGEFEALGGGGTNSTFNQRPRVLKL